MVEKDKRAIKKIKKMLLYFSPSSAPLSLQGVNIILSSFLKNTRFDSTSHYS
jgi:hypothetical protein